MHDIYVVSEDMQTVDVLIFLKNLVDSVVCSSSSSPVLGLHHEHRGGFCVPAAPDVGSGSEPSASVSCTPRSPCPLLHLGLRIVITEPNLISPGSPHSALSCCGVLPERIQYHTMRNSSKFSDSHKDSTSQLRTRTHIVQALSHGWRFLS